MQLAGNTSDGENDFIPQDPTLFSGVLHDHGNRSGDEASPVHRRQMV
jgi:hypothetical protein